MCGAGTPALGCATHSQSPGLTPTLLNRSKRPAARNQKAILHRNNSLFYKSLNGARVGDRFMSLIHTSELVKENPFEYLLTIQRDTEQVAASPRGWLPWTYRDTLARLETPPPTQAGAPPSSAVVEVSDARTDSRGEAAVRSGYQSRSSSASARRTAGIFQSRI